MYYRFIMDFSVRRKTEIIKAKNKKEAIELANEVPWEQEDEQYPIYHRIEYAKTLEDLENGDFEEDEETEF